mmetsp:Transcript_27365/g.37747  ORF Transcript_27365/g.37747 Transcript_27365/m.37747 type:complete len:694 (+) Transcript_27365:26-2107(+)
MKRFFKSPKKILKQSVSVQTECVIEESSCKESSVDTWGSLVRALKSSVKVISELGTQCPTAEFQEDVTEVVMSLMSQLPSERMAPILSKASKLREDKESDLDTSMENKEGVYKTGHTSHSEEREMSMASTGMATRSSLSGSSSGDTKPTSDIFDFYASFINKSGTYRKTDIAKRARASIELCMKNRAQAKRSEEDTEGPGEVSTFQKVDGFEWSSDIPLGFSLQNAFELLTKVFPLETLEQLQWDLGAEISQHHNEVSVFFSDIVGFTEWCSKHDSSTVIGCLSAYFQILDDLAEICGVYKVETIGDAWMAVCGAPKDNADHAKVMAHFALEMAGTVDDLRDIFADPFVSVRIGIHCGTVVSGVVRADRPRWQLFGDTVNMASRMESTGLPGVVQMSQDMFAALNASSVDFKAAPRGTIQIKGKGAQQTYILQEVNLGEKAMKMSKKRLSVFNPPVCRMRNRSLSLSKVDSPSQVDSGYESETLDVAGRNISAPAIPSDSRDSTRKSRNSRGIQQKFLFSSTLEDISEHLEVSRLKSSKGDSPEGFADHLTGSFPQRISADQPFGQRAVLLVDDKLSVLMQYRRVLQKSGLQVFTARDGLEGLFLMQQRQFVAVFMGLSLPKMSGSECVYKFRKWENDNRVRKQYILALAGKDDLEIEERDQLISKGFDAVESKTNSKAAILRCVTELLGVED